MGKSSAEDVRADFRESSKQGNPAKVAKDPLDLDYNYITGKPYSERFYQILAKRKELPAWDARANFVKIVQRNQTVILVGETGSGKTTQCPQYLMLAGLNKGKMIACTQPRRVAAMSVAQRVANEFDCQCGEQIGYTIRYDDVTSQDTMLKFCTDGMLLREAVSDPLLSRYSIIMLDEAHERTMQTDILFGFLKEVLKKRDDLKLVVMSATLESEKFQTYFNNAPIITIPGRTHPVEIFYTQKPEEDYVEASIRTALQIHGTEPEGDILIFLTGEEEIENVCTRLRDDSQSIKGKGELDVLPLYSSLPPKTQQLVFDKTKPGMRKVVVSTNVAETSITIDGIVYVIDPGYSKQKIYNCRKLVESLLVTPISQASAQQRSGRAGRTRPGKCFRLYPDSVFNTLDINTKPEMIRSGLSNMVITLLKLGVEDLVHFDYLDPPSPEMLMRAISQLVKLEVISVETGSLTPLGETMAELPLEPMQSRMLLHSYKFSCVNEILTIAAMLSIPSPFMRPRANAKEADRVKNEVFAHQDGDHLTLLNVYHAYLQVEQSGGNVERWCWDHYIQHRSMLLAINVRKQLADNLARTGIDFTSTAHGQKDYYTNIRKAILNGYFHQVAMMKDRQGRYVIVDRSVEENVLVHPSSVLKHTPEFLLYHEFALTSLQYIRTVTPVQGEWLLEVAPHYFTINAPAEDTDNFFKAGPIKSRLLELQQQVELRKNMKTSK